MPFANKTSESAKFKFCKREMSRKRVLEPLVSEEQLQAAHDMLLEGQFRLLDAGPIITDVRSALDRPDLWSDLMAPKLTDSKLSNDADKYAEQLWNEACGRVKQMSELINEAAKIRQKLYEVEFKRFENAAKIHAILQPVVTEHWSNRVPVQKRLLRSVTNSHRLLLTESPLGKETWVKFVESVIWKMFYLGEANVEWLLPSEDMTAKYKELKVDLDTHGELMEDRLQKAIRAAKL